MKILSICLLAASAYSCAAQSALVTPPGAAPAASSAANPTPARIAKGSKIFIEPMDGFENFLSAAILKKNVPILVVDNREQADFVIGGGSKLEPAGWAKTLFVTPLPHGSASFTIKDAHSGTLVFAYAVDKLGARKGDQSTAEACAKHLKEFIERK